MNSNSSSGIVNSTVLVPQNLPVGWRFHPTDEELVGYYLKRKRRGDPINGLDIGEVQLCNHDPWELPHLSKNKSGDKMWYFFCLREYHNNSGQAKRKTPSGSWKCTGDIRLVTSEESGEEIGTKRTLVFQNPDATQWVIHEYEYTAELNSPVQGNYVLCKLKMKSNKKKKAIKKTKKAEPDCKNARPNKKARTGKSDCNMASASAPALENSNSKGVMANLAYGDGEISNHMISDVDDQNSSKIAAIATYEKGESSYLEAFDYDHQSQYEMTSISTCNKGETSSLVASSFENQNFDQIIDVSACNKGEMRCPVAFDLENYNPNEMTPTSSYMKSIPSCPRASGLENHNSYEMTIVSRNNKCYETSFLKTFDFENQNSYEMTNKFFYEKAKPSSLDFENQNPGKSIDISASTEGKWSSLLEMPSDFDNQNHFRKTNMSILEDYRGMSTASSTQEGEEAMLKVVQNQYNKDMPILEDNCPLMASDVGEDTFPVIDPQQMEELIAFCELEDCLNSAPQQPRHTNEIPNLSTSLASVEEELIAFCELEDCLNSAPQQPIHTNEIPNYSTSLASAEELIAFCELEDCLNSVPQQPMQSNEIPNHSTSLASVHLN